MDGYALGNSDSVRDCHAVRNADAHPDADAYIDAYPDGDSHANADCDGNADHYADAARLMYRVFSYGKCPGKITTYRKFARIGDFPGKLSAGCY
jgi:hypothetical protein